MSILRTKAASIPTELIGASGRRYQFKELLQQRPHFGSVWLATCGGDKYVLKDIPKEIYANFKEIVQPRLRESRHIRLPFDDIRDQRIFVYKYLTDDFLTLVRKHIHMEAKKKILKATLQGIAELHAQDVLHLDIKPDNIMANCQHTDQKTVVERVQLTDLENTAYLPKGRAIKGMRPGNESWRSPEGHFRGELNKPYDVFSFGIVCIYAVLGRVIFALDDDFRHHEAQGALPFCIHLQRQISYFGDKDGINGLMKHVGDDEVNCQVLSMLWDERFADYIPYRPFSEWKDVDDASFKDLVPKMMSLDPARRISAADALKHPWFADC